MKRIIAMVLTCTLMLTACSATSDINVIDVTQTAEAEQADIEIEGSETQCVEYTVSENDELHISIKGLDDENMLQYIEDNMYTELVGALDSEEYFVENVEAVYYPKEYIEALASNSQANRYFGYTVAELDAQFQGTKYIFTLGEYGQTCAVPMETLTEDVYIKTLEDVIVGTGVILICVTVSVVSAPAAPAVSMIFAASATTGTRVALESGAMSFAAAIAKGYETENFEQALKAGAEAAGEGFKWGAITGAIMGGGSEAISLKGATANGLTMNKAARIQRETKWPLDIIKSIHSYDEYNIYKTAGLKPTRFSPSKWAFTREIDWSLVDSQGRTNVQRVSKWGLAPIDKDGMSYELHHVGQKADSPLAILSKNEHRSKDNYSILHYTEEGKNVTDDVWRKQKKEFWNDLLKKAKEQGKA